MGFRQVALLDQVAGHAEIAQHLGDTNHRQADRIDADDLGREPDIWTDGNPAKERKCFVAQSGSVMSPEAAFAEALGERYENPALVITSVFVREILPRVRAMGWTGDVFDYDGNRL